MFQEKSPRWQLNCQFSFPESPQHEVGEPQGKPFSNFLPLILFMLMGFNPASVLLLKILELFDESLTFLSFGKGSNLFADIRFK